VISEAYGYLVAVKSPEEISKKIIDALNKEWNCEEILKYVRQFTWSDVAIKTLQIYRNIV